MFELLLELFRHGMTMLFGTFLSAVFLRVEMNRRNVLILSFFSALALGLQGILFVLRDVTFLTMYYPLIAHLPLALLFVLAFRQKLIHVVFAITTAYLCCQIANWASMVPTSFSGDTMAVDLTYTIVLTATFAFICKYAAGSFVNLYSKPVGSFLTFAIVPGFYYVFDYLSTVYSDLLYSHNMLVVEFTPFLLCMCYMFFCTVYFRQYEEKLEVEQHNQLMQMQQSRAEKEMKAIQHSEKTIALLRHDMRHFLGTVSEYIETNQLDKAKDYIRDIIEVTDSTRKKKYCANDTVNMILSYYEETLESFSVQFTYDLQLPTRVKLSDVDLTSILSNGLENAIHAVSALPEERRQIHMSLSEKGGKILLSIKNPYGQTPKFVGDMPVSKESGHGYGTQSIRYTVEKLGGNCQFALVEGQFVMRVIV
ncbi:MAG: sensor histidine kinase [Firmicutes bacterium]|nr:sensor histidine kinase [Bacillota bacterium]